MAIGQGSVEGVVMNVFQGRSVFLTGHTGFKGSWLALWLHELGAKVHGYALAPLKPSLFDEANVAETLASHTVGDVRDHEGLLRAMSAAKPEIVLHLAAQALVRASYRDPRETFETNVMGTVNLFEAVRKTPSVRVAQVITSDKCYENREWVYAYRENDAMRGYDPYSASKGCAEVVVGAYRRSFFNPEKFDGHKVSVASSRAGNVIGGGDWGEDRLIGDVVRGVQAGTAVKVRNPESIRPWQHVLNPLSGYLLLAEELSKSPDVAQAWNFGPQEGDAQTVRWILELLERLWGGAFSWELDGGENPPEAGRLELDSSKAQRHLGWHPQWDLRQALERVVEWHEAQRRGEDMRGVSLSQIERFG